jgi:hypothetical protein
MQIMQVSYSASRMCSSRAITFTFTRAHTHTHTHTHAFNFQSTTRAFHMRACARMHSHSHTQSCSRAHLHRTGNAVHHCARRQERIAARSHRCAAAVWLTHHGASCALVHLQGQLWHLYGCTIFLSRANMHIRTHSELLACANFSHPYTHVHTHTHTHTHSLTHTHTQPHAHTDTQSQYL